MSAHASDGLTGWGGRPGNGAREQGARVRSEWQRGEAQRAPHRRHEAVDQASQACEGPQARQHAQADQEGPRSTARSVV